ncbi:MAG: cyclic pyranopterin monophosphate synthase MoaC [Spirochaetales bacterium]|nr:cyclic pyranopterin monophosphate synthase MoaC [Spirochaetales bacterium]
MAEKSGELTHMNDQNRSRMVNVGGKAVTDRMALAGGTIFLPSPVIELIEEKKIKKGDVLAVAQVAGIMAAKETSRTIPMCHPLALSGVDIVFIVNTDSIEIFATVSCTGKTGVEMEALSAVSAAALTIYDMCKSTGHNMTIGEIALLYKEGGKSDYLKKKDGPAGTVLAVNRSEKKGTVKHPIGEGLFVVDGGLEGDAHFGPGLRQVSLLGKESIASQEEKLGRPLPDGSFGENLIIQGLTLYTLPLGTLFKGGTAFFRLSKIGKECHSGCEIKVLTGDCVMPREGVFCQVIKGGVVKEGDTLEIIK